MKKIKILYTIPNFDTAGSGKVVYDLVKGLDKQRFEPEICCFHTKGEFFKEIEQLGVKIHLFPFAINYIPYVTFPFRLFRTILFFTKHKFDIIHSWHWSSDFSEPLAAKLSGIPFVYTKKAMGWGNKAWIWRSKLSTKIIAINNDMMTQFFADMQNKAVQIPLGVDTRYFHPKQKTYKSPEGIMITKDDFVIVSVANLVPIKGIEILLNAVKTINDSHIKTLIIGDESSEYGQQLQQQFNNDQVYFVGKKLDVRPYLAMADVFVIPTKDEGEGMPIALMEAMAMGKIVVGSRVSGIIDILKGFQDNLVEPSNEDSLCQKIIYFKHLNVNVRSLLEEKTRNYMVDNFSLVKFINTHENFYFSMLK